MGDEEKQAIEKLHNGKKTDLISIIRTFKREGIENFVVTKRETVETILNLIEKQQAEIRQYEKTLHDQIIKDYDMESKLKSELEKKDKIINKMSEQLTSPIHSKEWVIEYYTKEVEDK